MESRSEDVLSFFIFAPPISAVLDFEIFSNVALRVKSLPTPDVANAGKLS